MNIQVPLLLVGITATTGVGVGTIAVNSGAISIEDLSLLTAGTSIEQQIPVDVISPVGATQRPAPTATNGDTGALVDDGTGQFVGSASSSTSTGGHSGSVANPSRTSGGTAATSTGTGTTTASTGSSTSTTHGTSGGSTTAGSTSTGTTGTHHEDDDDDHDDHDDHEDHDDDDESDD